MQDRGADSKISNGVDSESSIAPLSKGLSAEDCRWSDTCCLGGMVKNLPTVIQSGWSAVLLCNILRIASRITDIILQSRPVFQPVGSFFTQLHFVKHIKEERN